MKEKLMIIGSGGHGRVVADCALDTYKTVVFIESDESKVGTEYFGCKVIDSQQNIEKYKKEYDFFVAVGNNEIRSKLQKGLSNAGYTIATIIHKSAVVSRAATIGKGSVLLANSVVNCGSVIGDGAIINTGATVDHDCKIGSFSHISPGASLAGTVTLGSKAWVGVGASVINNVAIDSDTIIGAGAVVTKDIIEAGTYVGVPARRTVK